MRARWRRQRNFCAAVLMAAWISSAPTTSAADPAAASADKTGRSVDSAFSALNALRRKAQRAAGPVAAWQIYHDAWQRSDGQMRYFIAQVLAAVESEIGLYAEALDDHPGAALQTLETPSEYPDPRRYVAEPAAAAIAALAADRRIIVVNEAHHVAQTRWLSLQLLPRLRALGYTHFAAETLDPRDRDLTRRGYPVTASGYYSREPLYGEVIRRALQLGFQVVAYESEQADASRDQREAEQAENLYKRVFAHNAQARLFVHAGYAHAHKRAGYLWSTRPMAAQLAQRAGIEFLSVDQSVLRPGAKGREYGAYALLLADYTPQAPVVLRDRTSAALWSLEPGYYDISVILPRGELVDARPDWLDLAGTRRATPIMLPICAATFPCLLEARHGGESQDAVPADRWLQRSPAGRAVLYLSPGSYRLRASSANGNVLGQRDLQVSFAGREPEA